MLQALIHIIAHLPAQLAAICYWAWVHYFRHDPVILGAFVVAILAVIALWILWRRGPMWRGQ